MKLFKPVIILLFTLMLSPCFSQTVVVQSLIRLPTDTVIKNELIGSLNGFLRQKSQANTKNEYILKEDLLATSDMLDEIKGMDQGAKAKDFFKCYLTNVNKINSHDYLVQFSYLGMTDNSPVLRASYRVIAKRRGNKFYFSSPLKQNTIGWKVKKIDNVTYYYKDTLNAVEAKAYQKAVDLDDRLLNAPKLPIAFYYCDNFAEVLQVLGIDFKLDYNGIQYNSLNSHENNEGLVVNGRSSEKQRFNPHDLWHERLHNVMKPDTINRPVDEGCAYLFGGSWEYNWGEVLAKFKKYAVDNPKADWLDLYTKNTDFVNDNKPLVIAYALNALIVQKINNEKGFVPVMELLSCGKRQNGDDNYFAALKKIAGIGKANFNAKMWELIRAEK